MEALYPGYSLFFLFDNAISHSVYAKDAFQIKDMNKSSGEKHWKRKDQNCAAYEFLEW